MYDAELVALRNSRHPVLVSAIRCSLDASLEDMGLRETIWVLSLRRECDQSCARRLAGSGSSPSR